MEQIFLAKQALIGTELKQNLVITIRNGIIAAIEPLEESSVDRKEMRPMDGVLLPGLVNGHSHAFQVYLRGRADHPRNFRDWVDSYLYPLVLKLNEESLYQSSYTAFRQMIRNGVTTVGEFHYIHNLNEEIEEPAEIVIKAAMDAGIRIRLLYTGYDLGNKEGQKRFQRSPEKVIESLDLLHEKYKDQKKIHVGTAPHSLHGASSEMIQLLVNWAVQKEEIAHIHLAEQKSDIGESLEQFGKRPAEVLDSLGVLCPNLAIVHGIWLDDDEIQLLGSKGVKHVYNPLTNMYLGDGIANLPFYLKHGVPTSVGTDANVSLDLLKEVRMAEWLQRIKYLEMGILKRYSRTDIASELYSMATKNGGLALNLPIGEIKVGNYADFILIDDKDLSLIEKSPLINQLVTSYSMPHGLKEVWVGGNLVYESQNSTRFSPPKKES